MRIELDEMNELNGQFWIVEKCDWVGCIKATRFVKDENDEFVIEEIFQHTTDFIIDVIEEMTGIKIEIGR